MRKIAVHVVLGILFLAGTCLAGEKPALKGEKDKISYAVGYQVGGDFKRQGIELNPELFVQGIQDAMSGNEQRLTDKEMQVILMNLKKQVVAEERKMQMEAARKNLEAGEKFLAENGKKNGVITLPSGLQYQVLAEGKGKSPAPTDNVTVHYRGTLIDGTEVDSSYKRNEPATFGLDRVIAGWKEALPRMKEGAKWRIFVPAKLGYGALGAGAAVPPNSVLIFEIELISVQPSG